MVGKTIRIMIPTAEPKVVEKTVAPRVSDLNHKVLGFLDNGWWSFGIVLRRFEELASARYKLAGVVKKKNPVASSGALAEVINELTTKCDVVVNGLAN